MNGPAATAGSVTGPPGRPAGRAHRWTETDLSGNRTEEIEGAPAPPTFAVDSLDADSRQWLDRLTSSGPSRVDAIEALFDLLRRAAVREIQRRRGSLPAHMASDLDDLALQAAGDAVAAVLRKLPDYRGASRFTTWAYKFVVFEVSTELRRGAWRGRSMNIDEASWERLIDTAPVDPAVETEGRELLLAIQRAIRTRLTIRQREVLVAVTLMNVPIDVMAERNGTSRGATYKVLHDARRKLHRALEVDGWQLHEIGRGA